jgi:hypothetical protein
MEPQGETYTEDGADNGEVVVVVGKDKESSTWEEDAGKWEEEVAWHTR